METVHCGFQHTRFTWPGRRVLDSCWVRVGDRPDSVAITSQGTYGRRQFERLAAIKEFDFPQRELDVEEVALEPTEVVRRFAPEGLGEAGPAPGTIGLALCIHDSRLVWRVHVVTPLLGVRTLIVGARNGEICTRGSTASTRLRLIPVERR